MVMNSLLNMTYWWFVGIEVNAFIAWQLGSLKNNFGLKIVFYDILLKRIMGITIIELKRLF